MRRLLVIGCAGAGKSTLARALAGTHRPRIEAAIDRFGRRERLWRVPDDAAASALVAQLGAP